MAAYTIDQMKLYPWGLIGRTAKDICPAPTMLSDGEIQMLYWLASEYCSGDGEIVDLGCFLGGSTLALAKGLAANLHSSNARVHTYDIFKCPNEVYSAGLIGHGKQPGDLVFDLFEANTAEVAQLVDVNHGDILEFEWADQPIEILFVDICKTWRINAHVIRQFFPYLIPGKSILIQQDYNHGWLPWVHMTMAFFEDYFEYIADHNGSRVYINTKEIPSALIATDLEFDLSHEKRLSLLDRETAKNSPYSAAMVSMSKGMYLFQTEGLAAALSHISPKNFVFSNVDYVAQQLETMRDSLIQLKDVEGYDAWHKKEFISR